MPARFRQRARLQVTCVAGGVPARGAAALSVRCPSVSCRGAPGSVLRTADSKSAPGAGRARKPHPAGPTPQTEYERCMPVAARIGPQIEGGQVSRSLSWERPRHACGVVRVEVVGEIYMDPASCRARRRRRDLLRARRRDVWRARRSAIGSSSRQLLAACRDPRVTSEWKPRRLRLNLKNRAAIDSPLLAARDVPVRD